MTTQYRMIEIKCSNYDNYGSAYFPRTSFVALSELWLDLRFKSNHVVTLPRTRQFLTEWRNITCRYVSWRKVSLNAFRAEIGFIGKDNIHRRRLDNTFSQSCLHEGQNSLETRARGKKLRVPLEKMKRNVLWLSVLLFALLFLSLTLSPRSFLLFPRHRKEEWPRGKGLGAKLADVDNTGYQTARF